MPRLTPQEQREILRFIEADKPLPEKYRFLLFEDKREVELVWNGKTNEVCNVVLPFQTIENVDEPRVEKPTKQQIASLFDIDPRGRQLKGWTNKLIWGDNKLILSSLKSGPMREEIEAQGGLKLIYIDPPFDVGADFSMNIEIGEETFTKKPNILEEIAYRDTWGKGADSFISMIYERFSLMRDVLADDGSIFVHMGESMSANVRGTLDEVFGCSNFRNEIILPGRAVKNLQQQFDSIQKLSVRHDYLYWYSKNATTRFRPVWMEKHASGNPEGHWHHFWSTADRPTMRYQLFGHTPKSGQWVWKEERANIAIKNYERFLRESCGRTLAQYWRDTGAILEFIRSSPDDGKPQYWREPAELRLADTVWSGCPIYSNESKYPTEKNEAFIRQVLSMASSEGDLVADFFCGSGTTAAVAEKLGRKWITTDLGKFAIHTTRKRLIGVQRQLKAEGKNYRAFEILNLGKYERQHYIGVNPDLREEQKQQQLAARESAFLDLILRAYLAEKVEGFTTFHGKKAGRLVVVGPVNMPVTRLFVEEIILECRKKHFTKVDILGFEFEMGLFPNVLDEARAKGIDISPKYIPAEVFDKRAVEKNQVVFHDVAFIEVKPHYKKNGVAVELTDFSVFYSQDSVAAVEAALKNKASKIVVERGQIIKVAKDNNGIVTREALTQKWTDWIDYWSVDFDFESKREIIREKNPDTGEIEEKWTGDFVFENEWQSFRTKKDRNLELTSVFYTYPDASRKKIAVKVVDIFGNDTMTIVEVNVGK